jgi:hypothetical protein
MCHVLKVYRSGYYAWKATPMSQRALGIIGDVTQLNCVILHPITLVKEKDAAPSKNRYAEYATTPYTTRQ